MDRDDMVASLAGASAKNIPAAWKFRRTGKFIVNDQDTESFIGEVWYANGAFEIGPAIQVRNWVFVLERDIEPIRKEKNLNDDWFVSAFKGADHFTFNCQIPNQLGTRNPDFMRYIVCTFWPILHPESFDSFENTTVEERKMVKMRFRAEVL
jgi:hypothetical protein